MFTIDDMGKEYHMYIFVYVSLYGCCLMFKTFSFVSLRLE